MANCEGGRWVRGIVHLHSQYSDGIHTLGTLKGMAVERGYEFMVVCDHSDQMTPREHLRYVDECDGLSSDRFVAVPGVEFATEWTQPDGLAPGAKGRDRSQAHTLALPIGPGKLAEIRERLVRVATDGPHAGQPVLGYEGSAADLVAVLDDVGHFPAAAHQFQYTPLSTRALTRPIGGVLGEEDAADSDYRYEMGAAQAAAGVDFYYRTLKDIDHEPEDLALYNGLVRKWLDAQRRSPRARHEAVPLPWAYAGSDFHGGRFGIAVGPALAGLASAGAACALYQSLWRGVAAERQRWRAGLSAVIAAAGGGLGLLAGTWKQDVLGKRVGSRIERGLDTLANHLVGGERKSRAQRWLEKSSPSPAHGLAHEQLCHATWIWLPETESLTRENVCRALREGRTCAARSRHEELSLLGVWPTPGTEVHAEAGKPTIRFGIGFEPAASRPLYPFVFRDGVEVTGFTATWDARADRVTVQWRDPDAGKGLHAYVVGVAGKFVSSPILVDVGAAAHKAAPGEAKEVPQ